MTTQPSGSTVLAQFAVEHQLIAACLRHLRRRSQFVEKENAFATGRQELRRNPLGSVRGDAGQTAEIDRIELHSPDIEKLPVEIGGNLGNDLRLADAARAPDVQRHTFADQRMKRLKEFRGFHGIESFPDVREIWAGRRLCADRTGIRPIEPRLSS